MTIAPVRVLGWDERNNFWAASRDGEPDFIGVQDLGDAYLASSARGADLVVPENVYREMVQRGEAPDVRPPWALLEASPGA